MKKTLPALFLLIVIFLFSPLASATPNWGAIDKLLKEGKLAQASVLINTHLKQARRNKDNKSWQQALILGAALKSQQGEYENALKYLNQPWPQDNESKMLINLHRAKLLANYIQNYRWEIQGREKITSKKRLPLKKKTLGQLVQETNLAFAKAYTFSVKQNDTLDKFTLPLSSIKNYFVKPDYPPQIRGRIRDTISYLWADFLQDSSLWSPQEGAQKNRFGLKQLLAISYRDNLGFNTKSHPLKRMLWLLSDLEYYQNTQKNPQAALEAFRVKIEKLAELKSSPADLKQLITVLKRRIAQTNKALPWINMLRNTQAKLIRQTNTADANIQSVAVLQECLKAHKKQRATAFCQRQLDDITRPSINLSGMKSDGLMKRSLLVNHKNVKQLYFRAWKLDIPQVLQEKDYQAISNILLKSHKKAQQSWSIKLPPTPDYRAHKTYLSPPIHGYGYWLIAASTRPDFALKNNAISTIALNLTELVASTQSDGNNLTVNVYNGETGQPLSNVTAQLWTQDYNKPTRLLNTQQTSGQGVARFKLNQDNRFKILLKNKKSFSVISDIYTYQREPQRSEYNALIFTDRAIYRPGQKVFWKVVAYQGNRYKGKYSVVANNAGWVKLFDANGKLVKKLKAKTNQFGSASGEFIAKTGLLLGNWQIKSAWGGNQSIKVEEYKRPTFSVKIATPKQSLTLNRPASIDISANYYFGQAVDSGTLKWRVVRQPVYLWQYGGGGQLNELTVASGNSKLDADGKVTIKFIPQAPEPKHLTGINRKNLTYTYDISAELTDAGGETREASKSLVIGKLGISADINTNMQYGLAGNDYQLSVLRRDLNNIPRPGNASWELFLLKQPDSPRLPSEKPLVTEQSKSKYATPGDRMRPRWERFNESLQTTTQYWREAKKVRQGHLKHNASGNAEIMLKGLQAGLYRLRYLSKDNWGQAYKKQQLIVIAQKNQATIQSPALLMPQQSSVEVGENLRLLAGSAFQQVASQLEIYHANQLLKRITLKGGIRQINFPVKPEYRGGLSIVLTVIKDYQLLREEHFVNVPWTNKNLDVSFSTFRDKLEPGQKEKWRITLKDSKGKPLGKGAAELLASMYDRSLDFFVKHYPPEVAHLYYQRSLALDRRNSLGRNGSLYSKRYESTHSAKNYQEAALKLMLRNLVFAEADDVVYPAPPSIPLPAPMAAPRRAMAPMKPKAAINVTGLQKKLAEDAKKTEQTVELKSVKTRTNFNETAFFYPHLILGDNGSVAFEFEVPESLTQWEVWVSAITKDLRGGSTSQLARTSKELMVRPYLPRFLRAGDRAEIEVLVNNAGDKPLNGKLDFDVLDPVTLKSIAKRFKLSNNNRAFKVAAGKSSRLRFSIIAPKELGVVAIRARASASNGTQTFADGEQRPMPVLPSRIHLSQSRFTALQGNMSKTLQFKALATNTDASRSNDKLVVTVDGQLFYSTLNALPYLVNYPYECTEQTMNRFLSSSIMHSTFKQHPAIANMAKKIAQRNSQLEKWETVDKDPNRKMLLEETPWLEEAQGGTAKADKLVAVLDPKTAQKNYHSALAKLHKAQNSSGGFPWWEGGRDSPYMTAYLLHGFSRALEFKVDIPKDMVQKAWRYLNKHYKKNLKKKPNKHLPEITLINYVISAYPDTSWTGGVFSAKDRKAMLDTSFKHWRKLSPLLKAYLALTLKRSGREQQAKLVFDSLMDSAKTDQDQGTYWAPEDRSWLWYNDRVDTHAFMLRAMMELDPTDKRRHGLVQWLMLNKKLNHWKSTRATAESIYALVHYLKQENQLGKEQRASIKIGNHFSKQLIFKPNEYTGAKNQTVVKGDKITSDMANITVSNQGKSLMFASASWHFSTEKLPASASGDFFNVKRTFFKRVHKGKGWQLLPLQEGATLKVGDQLEVQLSLRAKHAVEYVHLRAPRGAGFEPEDATSGYRWKTGIGYYEEIRDSGANYFFDWLPAGQYSFKYRLRATTAGAFRVAPATVQSIYAPEFNAYSSGKRLNIR